MKNKLLVLTILLFSSISFAAPAGGNVVEGAETITDTLNITQTSELAIIEWQSFGLAADDGSGTGETFTVNGQEQDWILINKVLGGNISEINGNIVADGSVWLINPAGIMIGAGATINTFGFVASTLDVNVENVEGDIFNFSRAQGYADATVTLHGNIVTKGVGGYVMLAGTHVVHNGFIAARLGKVALVAGASFTLDFNGDGLINFTSDSMNEVSVAGITDVSYQVALDPNNTSLDNFINTSNAVATNVTQAGDVLIFGGPVIINNATIKANSDYKAGNIDITSTQDDINIDSSYLNAYSKYESYSDGALSLDSTSYLTDLFVGGSINLTAENGSIISNNTTLDTRGTFNSYTDSNNPKTDFSNITNFAVAGDISMWANSNIELTNTYLYSYGSVYSYADSVDNNNSFSDIENIAIGGDVSLSSGGNINLNNVIVLNLADFYSDNHPNIINYAEGGKMDLDASEINIMNSSLYSYSTSGNGGSIDLDADLVSLTSTIMDVNTYSGLGGTIDINANNIDISSSSSLTSYSGINQAGQITLEALENLNINSSSISANSNLGNGGDIELNAFNSVYLNMSSLNANGYSSFDGNGSGGSIVLLADDGDVSVVTGSGIYTNGSGNISISAGNNVEISDHTYISSPEGDITLKAKNNITLDFDLSSYGGLYVDTYYSQAGNIFIDAVGDVHLVGQNLDLFAKSYADGSGGTINIKAYNINSDAELNVFSENGKAGSINLTYSGEVTSSNGKFIVGDGELAIEDGNTIELESGVEIDSQKITFESSDNLSISSVLSAGTIILDTKKILSPLNILMESDTSLIGDAAKRTTITAVPNLNISGDAQYQLLIKDIIGFVKGSYNGFSISLINDTNNAVFKSSTALESMVLEDTSELFTVTDDYGDSQVLNAKNSDDIINAP